MAHSPIFCKLTSIFFIETKYPNLFDCPNKDGFEEALNCLTYKGDVAVTMQSSVEKFFNKPEYHSKTENFRYLCPDNTMRPLSTPCVWIEQPEDLIVIAR